MGTDSKAAKLAKPATHPLARGYLEHLAQERRLSRHTVENYGRDIAALIALAGTTPLHDLAVQHVRRFVAQLHSRGLDGRSLARMLSAWRGFYHYLARDHGCTVNPCLGIKPPKSAKRLPHALSPDEAGRLMEIDALYCDVIVMRWQQLTGKAATLDGSGQTFEAVKRERAVAPEAAS